MEYLFTIDYGSDAERKRIDYIVERWSNRTEIKKSKGTVLLFKGPDVEEFIEDLYSRVRDGKIEIYRLEPYKPSVGEKSKELVYKSSKPPEALQSFLNYLMSKIGASYEHTDKGNNITHYTAYTKKGQAKLEIHWLDLACGAEGEEKTLRFAIIVRGYGEVVDFIADRLAEDMKIFLG